MTPDPSLAARPVVTRRLADALWFNALWFQTLWFCAVLGGDSLLPIALLLLLFHVWLVGDTRTELRQLLIVGGVGITVDAVLSASGVFIFHGSVLVPLWLCCLWFGFAAALGRSLAWLAVRPYLCSVAGAIAFPLNYWAGKRLGAVDFAYSLPVTLAILALIWAVILPGMFWMTARLQATTLRSNP